MPDNRPLLEKLQAMANQTASPDEAEIAREMIRRMALERHEAPSGSSRVLSREAILGTPDRQVSGKTLRLRTASGTWYTIDVDEMDINIQPIINEVD